jgi:predicted Ser/Thr protein kinase
MTEPDRPVTCPLCRDPIAADAPAGACPKCLLDAGTPTGGKAAEADGLGAADVAAKFPDYEILGFLGRGGMGVVWKARHRGLDRVVALKVLPHDVASAAGFAERFQREARALARLSHPNIVAVHEFGDRDGAYFLVMEFVDGVNMRQALREGRIGARDVLRVVPQICDALQYAHDHGVVHRDIKPENVLIAADGRVKVADFGLAKIVGGDTVVDLTLPGQVMGTPAYMAPEQVERPTSVDHRADIYSLGVVFYEMLTGELPLGRFEAPSKRVQVDVRFDEVVLRSLEKQPERRWQQAAEVKSEVGAIAAAPVAAPARPSSPVTNRLAVVSLVLALAAPPVAFLGLWIAGAHEGLSGLPVALGGACLLSALSGGVVSWIQIARSKGAERGLGYAIGATILALVMPCLASPFVWVLAERESASVESGPRISVPAVGLPGTDRRAPDLADGTENLPGALALAQLQGLTDRAALDVLPLYAAADRSALARRIVATSDPMETRSLGGLPLATLDWSAERIAALVVTTQETVGDRNHWRVTAVDGRRDVSVAFDVVLEDGEPRFRATPVEFRSATGIASSLTEPVDTRMQLRDLWFALQRAHPRIPVSDVNQWYVRDAWPRVVDRWKEGGAEAAARGERGLPFMSEEAIGEPLAEFHSFSVAIDDPTRSARLVATSDTRKLTVWLRFSESVWRFTDDPVKVEPK